MLLKREREKFVFSTENITFAILICIVRFLVKESASITMCSFTNTLCVITGDSKKGYNIGIPSIIHWIGKPPTVKLEVFAFYDHYSRISKYSTICFLEVANPYITLFSVIKVLQESFYLQTLTILKHIYSQKKCNFAPEITTGKLLS